MAHIAIEGMDGVGKTTTCKLLAERLGYKFIEKNLRFLFDENDEFDEEDDSELDDGDYSMGQYESGGEDVGDDDGDSGGDED